MSRLNKRRATADDVKSAAKAGNAQLKFFNRYGRLPKSDEDMALAFAISVNLASKATHK